LIHSRPIMLGSRTDDGHAISQLKAGMEKRGLLNKIKDLPKTNLVRIALTETGEQKYRQTQAIQSIQNVFSVQPEKERSELSGYLMQLWDRSSRAGE
jgi:hypothetical protein